MKTSVNPGKRLGETGAQYRARMAAESTATGAEENHADIGNGSGVQRRGEEDGDGGSASVESGSVEVSTEGSVEGGASDEDPGGQSDDAS